MDKISSILPASPRTQVAEVSASQPARPGAPMTGRPEGRNSLGDRITLSKELEKMKQAGALPAQAPEVEASPTYKNTVENSKLKTIQELNKKFFSNPKEIARENSTVTRSEEILQSVEDAEPMIAPRIQQENRGLPMSKGEMLP